MNTEIEIESEDEPSEEIELHELVASDDAKGERLDKYLADALPLLSRSRIKHLVEKGLVFVNQNRQTNVSYKIKGGEQLQIQVPAPPPCDPEPENIPLEVLYEDGHLLVINKPAGLSVHPAPGNWTGTLVNAVLYHCGDSLKEIGAMGRPGIIHRLDKDTSGVMVVCKSAFAMTSLGHQFQNRTIDRLYHAFCIGVPQPPHPKSGRIEARIVRDPRDRKRMTTIDNDAIAGKSAATNYETLQVFGMGKGEQARPLATLMQCKLESGRTHQVRVHMQKIGCPLIGDMVYGNNNGQKKLQALLPEEARITRQALHAKTLSFTHPATSERMSFESEYPEDMQITLQALREL